jgi:hypothetical protein
VTLSQLLRRTVARYESAMRGVLADWSPECGCQRPGATPRCEACPCLSKFERLVQEEIARSSQNQVNDSPVTENEHDPTECIYFSQPQI